MTRDTKDLIVALDIGTSKVIAVVAEILPGGQFEVLGLGQHASLGMRKGVVVNIESTVNSIQKALEERSEEHTSELQSRGHLVCRLLLEKKKKQILRHI